MFRKKKPILGVKEYSFIDEACYLPITEQIDDLSGLPKDHYELFYKASLNRFLALTQHCSKEELLEHFNSVVKSLKMRRSLILPLDSDAESINKQKDLWTYSIFVASVMFGAYKLIARQVLFNDNSDYRKWSPFDKPIPNGSDIKTLAPMELTPHATTIFLPLIFCPRSLSWLYRDREVFNTAIELAHAPNPNTRLGQLITNAHQGFDNTALTNKAVGDKAAAKVQEDDPENPPEKPNPPAPSFQQWLKDTITNNRLSPFVCETIDGYAISDPAIFKAYCKEVNESEHETVRNSFFKLKIHKKGPPIKFAGGPNKKALYIADLSTL